MKEQVQCLWCSRYTDKPTINEAMDIVKVGGTDDGTTEEGWQILAKARLYTLESMLKCSHCGERVMRSLTNEEILERGYELYNEFKRFMVDAELPDEISITIKHSNEYVGTVGFDKEMGKYVVTVNSALIFDPCDIKPVFFHEFAHILTSYDPLTGGEREDVNDKKWESEYLAAQIEMKTMLGFENINHKKEIGPNSELIYKNKVATLFEYIKQYVEDSVASINIHNNDGFTKVGMAAIIRSIMYCHGKINFCKKYFDAGLPNINAIGDCVKERFKDKRGRKDWEFEYEFSRLMQQVSENTDGKLDEVITKIYSLLYIYEFGDTLQADSWKVVNNLDEHSKKGKVARRKELAASILQAGETKETVNKAAASQVYEIAKVEMALKNCINFNIMRMMEGVTKNFTQYVYKSGRVFKFNEPLWKRHFIDGK